MTGIFQVFDRYKSKSYTKSDRRKSISGESESKGISSFYLVEDDVVPRKVVLEQCNPPSRPEALEDSLRPSSANVSEVVVKTLILSEEPQTAKAQIPRSTRPPADSHKSSLFGHKISSPRETEKGTAGSNDFAWNHESYSSDAVTPKSTVPWRSSLDNRSRKDDKPLPRDARSVPKFLAHSDRSRASLENVQEISAHLGDAGDFSQPVLQMEASKSPYGGRELRRYWPSVRKNGHVQPYHSSGDGQEVENYHWVRCRNQSGGDVKVALHHIGASVSNESLRDFSVTSGAENNVVEAYVDEKDHHRPQFPSVGEDFLRSWQSTECRTYQSSNHVKETPRYTTSGDRMDSRKSNTSSGDERSAQPFHLQNERRGGNRNRGSRDPVRNRSFWPVTRDIERHHCAGVGFDGLRDESSGDERVSQRPPSGQRRHRKGPTDERGHKYNWGERGDDRRLAAYDAGRDSTQGLHSSGDERSYHRHLPAKGLRRRYPSMYYPGRRYQTSAAELIEHQRFQSAGEDQGEYMHHAHQASSHRPSIGGYEGRRYHSSADERGGILRSFVHACARTGGLKPDPLLHTCSSWQNESSDEDMEMFPQHYRYNIRKDARHSSHSTNAHRKYLLGNGDGHRHNSFSEDIRRDWSRSSITGASKYESAVDTRVAGEYQNGRGNTSHGEWGYEEFTSALFVPTRTVPKDVHWRNASVESRGEHRRRSSNSSVSSNQHSLMLHLPGEKARGSNLKDKESSSGCSRNLPPRSSCSYTSMQVSPRNLMDMRELTRLNVQVRESSQTLARRDSCCAESQKSLVVPDSLQLSPKSVTGSYDFREMLRQTDFKDSQWTSEKFGAGSLRNSVDGRDPPRTSNVSRASVDSRQYQTSTPRLSVDGREHFRASSLHSSRGSSVDAQVQLRTNSMDSNTSGELKRRGPSVVARLMGLAELPEIPLSSSDRSQTRQEIFSQELLNSPPAASPPSEWGKSQLHLSEVAQQMKQVAARLHQDSLLRQKSLQDQHETRLKRKSKIKSRAQERSWSPAHTPASMEKDARGLSQHEGYGIFGRQIEPRSPLPRQPMSPRHHQMERMPHVLKKQSAQGVSSGDLDQRLHQLRIRNSIQEHRTLKQILEAMRMKGLLLPQKNLLHSSRAELNKSGYRKEAKRPFRDFMLKLSPSASNVARANPNEYQKQLNSEDFMSIDVKVHELPAVDFDYSGEASIVVMKPVISHSTNTPAATKELDVNSESVSGFEREKIEIGRRRRGSERRAGSGRKLSRSYSLEPPERASSNKTQVDDLSFASVMLSWRERIAADLAKRATADAAEVRLQSRSKSASLKHWSQDVSPSKPSGLTGKRFENPRVPESQDTNILYHRQDYDSGSRDALSDIAQGSANHDEDRFKIVCRSKSDLQLSAYSAETLAGAEASLDRVPAQVAVLRSKRSSGRTTRTKEKLRASHPGDLRSKSSVLPAGSNLKTGLLTGELFLETHLLDLSPVKITSPSKYSKGEGHCMTPSLQVLDDSLRMTPQTRKVSEPAVVREEGTQLPAAASTPQIKVPVTSSSEEDGLAQVFPGLLCTSFADCEAENPQIGKIEVAFDEEAHTPDAFVSGWDKCFSEDIAFTLQGVDHPSPVSVLDSPIFQEGFQLEELSTSPDSSTSSLLRHEDAEFLQREVSEASEPEAELFTPKSQASEEASDFTVTGSLELGENEAFRCPPYADPKISSSENSAALISVDYSKGRLYVQSILIESGLTEGTSGLPQDLLEIIKFDVFTRQEEQLQTAELSRIERGELEKTEEKRYKESLDRRLIFDCMNEILERKMSPFWNTQPWGSPAVRRKPGGLRLVDEVWDELIDLHWTRTVAYDALYSVLQKDFLQKNFDWLDFSVEISEVGCELEELVLQELVEECVQDLIFIIPNPVKMLHSVNLLPSPSPWDEAKSILRPPFFSARSEASSEESAVSSDDFERRRRELLDNTRKDLLAWHIQYQQL